MYRNYPSGPPLEHERTAELAVLIQAGRKEGASEAAKSAGREAHAELVSHYIAGAVRFAGWWAVGRPRLRGDLMQSAMVGLCEAARRFNPARDTHFNTYLKWWVKKECLNCIREQHLITTPAYFCRTETYRERGTRRAREKWERLVQQFKAAGGDHSSLDRPDGDSDRCDVLEARCEPPWAGMERADDLSQLHLAIEFLPVRERRVIEGRYDSSPVLTYRQLGEELHLTRQGVMVMHERAINQLHQFMEGRDR